MADPIERDMIRGAHVCSGQSRGPRQWSWCNAAIPFWRPTDARGRVRLWASREAAQAALFRALETAP